MRDGPHVVPVLPQGKAESPAQARMRLEAQACCASAVLPAGPEESGEHFEQRLEAGRLTPTRLSPPAVRTPTRAGPPAAGPPAAAKLVPWPVLPRGRHESDASFDLRLEIAVSCSVPAMPQGGEESDADCRTRLLAQQKAPHATLWPYHSQAKSERVSATAPVEYTSKCTGIGKYQGSTGSSTMLPLPPTSSLTY